MTDVSLESPDCLDDAAVAAHLAGDLRGPSPRAVAAHLASCGACRELVVHAAQSTTGVSVSELEGITTLADGERLCDRYVVRRFLARGGMGEVYEVDDEMLGETVALKTLNSSAILDERAIALLKAEVQVARRVSHENVCRLLEFGVHEKAGAGPVPIRLPFITMEFLRGETLSARLERGGPLPVDQARPLVLQMVNAIEAIHAAGIVHRDFKSANVILVPIDGGGDRVVVTDFGLARVQVAARKPQTEGLVLGTLEYMAPEQIGGAAATPGFDVYALGVVIFEMLAGVRPFVGKNPLEAAAKRLSGRAPRLSRKAPVGPGWDDIVAGCLEPDPMKRWRHAHDIGVAVASADRRRLVRRGFVPVVAAAIVALGLLHWWPSSKQSSSPRPMRVAMPLVALPPLSSPPKRAAEGTASPAVAADPDVPARALDQPRSGDKPSPRLRRSRSTSGQPRAAEPAAPAVAAPASPAGSSPVPPPALAPAPSLGHPDDVANPFLLAR